MVSPTVKLRPDHPGRTRWLPRHGEPLCVLEFISQTLVRALAWAPLYTAVVATLTLLVLLATLVWGN